MVIDSMPSLSNDILLKFRTQARRNKSVYKIRPPLFQLTFLILNIDINNRNTTQIKEEICMFCSICGRFMRLGTWKISTQSHFGLGPHPDTYFCTCCAEEYKDHLVSSRLVTVTEN